jgi:uncharacterized protein DUF1579
MMKTRNEQLAIIISVVLTSGLPAEIVAQNAGGCARSESQALSVLVGRWKVRWRDRTSPGIYAETDATSTIENDPTRCLIVEHFSGTRAGERFAATALIGFGNADHLQLLLVDSAHGEFLEFEGTKKSEIVRFEWTKDLGGRRIMLRRDYRVEGRDSFTVEMQLSTDSGSTWDLVSRAQYQRQP